MDPTPSPSQSQPHALPVSAAPAAPAVGNVPRHHSDERVTHLSKLGEQTSVKGTVLDPVLARAGDLMEAAIFRDPKMSLAESVIKIERMLDPQASPEKQREQVELKLTLAGDTPLSRAASFEKAKAALTRYSMNEEKDIGKLLAELRKAGCGVHELTAKNANITLPNQPTLVLDGLTLKDCENVSIKGDRTPQDRAKGRFGAVAHGLVIDGAKGTVTIEGIDASGLTMRNLGQDQVSFLSFKQCQLRNASVEGESKVGVFSAVDCSFGSKVDFSALSMTNPPSTEAHLKALFGGTIWVPQGDIKLHQSFGFEAHKEILIELPYEKVPRLLLQPPSEAYLSHILKSSAVLQSRAAESSTPGASTPDSYTVSVSGTPVSFTVTQDEKGRSVIEQVAVGAHNEAAVAYKRDKDDPTASAQALEELLARLRAAKRHGPQADFRAKAFAFLTDNSETPEQVLDKALKAA